MVDERLFRRLWSTGDEMVDNELVFAHALLETGAVQRGNTKDNKADLVTQLFHCCQDLQVTEKGGKSEVKVRVEFKRPGEESTL